MEVLEWLLTGTILVWLNLWFMSAVYSQHMEDLFGMLLWLGTLDYFYITNLPYGLVIQ